MYLFLTFSQTKFFLHLFILSLVASFAIAITFNLTLITFFRKSLSRIRDIKMVQEVKTKVCLF